MASKAKITELLLAKGEKIAIFAAAGLLVGLLLWGAITAFGGDSPSTTAKAMTNEASRVESQYRNAAGKPPEVESRYVEGGLAEPVPATEFAHIGARWFEPTIEPSRLRDLPKVLTPEGPAQIDLVKGPMPSFDLVDDGRGGVMIGVLTTKPVGANEVRGIKDIKGRIAGRANQRPGGGAPGGFGGGPGFPGGGGGPGFPGGGGGPGFPGGGGGPGFPGGGGGPGFPGGGGGPGFPGGGFAGGQGGGRGGGGAGSPDGGGGFGGMGGGFNNQMQRTETTVAYKNIDDFNKGNLPPALSVYPLRMVMVQAAFPLKKQFEEIRKALKLQSLADAVRESGYLSSKPLFDGLIVERKIIYPSGQMFDWAPFDWEVEYYNHIYRRQLETTPENGWTAYFTRYDQKIAVPLPRLNDTLTAYPPISLDQIASAAKKLEDANRPQLTKSDQTKKFEGIKDRDKNLGGTNVIFQPTLGGAQGMSGFGGAPPISEGSSGPGIGGRAGKFGAGPGGPGGFGPGGPGGFGPGGPGGFGPGGPGGFGPGGQPPANPNEPPKIPTGETDPNKVYSLDEEYLLVRFVDPTVQPGLTYQYRLKVKLNNPNFGLPKDKVSQASYATKEVLESAWFTINQPIPIPPEMHVYSIDPAEHEKAVKDKFPKDPGMQALNKVLDGRQALVQIHRWMPEVRLADTNKREPVGTWVIGEVQAAPGEYIGRKQLVQLPTWSAEKGYYVLKELPEGLKLKGNVTVKDIPRGWLVDLSTDNILVDFDGGRFRGQIGDRTIQDDSAQEILVLRQDGTMYVRNSEWEKDLDPIKRPRERRASAWDAWLRMAEQMTPGSGSGFDRERGGPGGPGGKGGAGGGGGGNGGGAGSGGN